MIIAFFTKKTKKVEKAILLTQEKLNKMIDECRISGNSLDLSAKTTTTESGYFFPVITQTVTYYKGENLIFPNTIYHNKANFSGSVLRGCEFKNLSIEQPIFHNCDLSYSKFDNSEIKKVSFKDCLLGNCSFIEAQFIGGSIENSNLNSSDFSNFVCQDVALLGCDLSNTFLSNFSLAVIAFKGNRSESRKLEKTPLYSSNSGAKLNLSGAYIITCNSLKNIPITNLEKAIVFNTKIDIEQLSRAEFTTLFVDKKTLRHLGVKKSLHENFFTLSKTGQTNHQPEFTIQPLSRKALLEATRNEQAISKNQVLIIEEKKKKLLYTYYPEPDGRFTKKLVTQNTPSNENNICDRFEIKGFSFTILHTSPQFKNTSLDKLNDIKFRFREYK